MNLRIQALLRLLMVSSFLTIGCRAIQTDNNELTQLTKKWATCKVWNSTRIQAMLANMPQGFIQNFPAEAMPRVHSILAGIPDVYMKWLYQVHRQNQFHIRGNPNMQGGLTIENGSYPTSLEVGASEKDVESSLQHEIGHAIYPLLEHHNYKGSGPEFKRLLEAEALDNKKNPNLHGYPKSYINRNDIYNYRHEYWADAFNSYYCSPESNAMVKAQFPSTHEFLEKYLEPPVWETAQQDNGNAAMYLALAEPGNSITAAIATNTSIQNVGLCVGDNCTDFQKVIHHFRPYNKSTADRRFFVIDTVIPFEAGRNYTILGKDSNGGLQKQSFRLEKNQ